MESGSGPQPFRPGWGPGSPGDGPGGDREDPQEGPQSPAPEGPQSPSPGGPQSPGPAGPQSPSPGAAPPVAEPSPSFPGAPPPGPGASQAPGYGGPVPPGGWQQPLGRPPAPLTPGQGQLAGWGSRLGAYVIDFLIVVVPALVVLALLGGGVLASREGDSDAGLAAFVGAILLTLLVIAVIALLYAPLLMMRKGPNNGQTWGKQVVGIRVVRDSGEPYTFGSAALREVVLKNLAVGIASSIIPLIPWFLNFFWPLWDDQNRALHDMAASSHVVRA